MQTFRQQGVRSVTDANLISDSMEFLGFLSQLGQMALTEEVQAQLLGPGDAFDTVQTARQRRNRFIVFLVFTQCLPVRQGVPARVFVLAPAPKGDGRAGQPSRQDSQRQGDQPKGERPAATPLAPTLGQAAVRHALKRQIGQVAAQVCGQGRRIGIPFVRLHLEALGDDIGQPDGNFRVARSPRRLPRLSGRLRPTVQRFEQQQPERVDVGPAVHGDRDRTAFVDRPEGGELLRRHECRRAA